MKVTKAELGRFVDLTTSASYDERLKNIYHKLGRKLLKRIVEIMGLQKGDYDIRWNPGGIAVSGDHTLHTDWFYLALHDNIGSGWFYYRTVNGRKDFHGGPNIIVSWQTLLEHDLEGLAASIVRDCDHPTPDKAPKPMGIPVHFTTDFVHIPVKHTLTA